MGNNTPLTALVFGATGLTGGFVAEYLSQDERYGKVIIFSRQPIKLMGQKTELVIFDPEKFDEVAEAVNGDHLFCSIGTTIKKAGTQKKFFETDHDLVVKIAQAAKVAGVHSFVYVSSLGANPRSRNFYLRTKGMTESSLKQLSFRNLSIIRPSMLLGIRKEYRMAEEWGKVAMKAFNPLLCGRLKKYRSVHAADVAKAMIRAAFGSDGTHIIESDKFNL